MFKRIIKDFIGEVAEENGDDKIQWENYSIIKYLKDKHVEGGKMMLQ